MKKRLFLLTLFVFTVISAFSQKEVKTWEHLIKLEPSVGIRFESIENHDGQNFAYFSELMKVRDSDGYTYPIVAFTDWMLNAENETKSTSHYIVDTTSENKIIHRLNDRLPDLAPIRQIAQLTEEKPWVKSPVHDYKEIFIRDSFNIRQESILWHNEAAVSYVPNTNSMGKFSNKRTKLPLELPQLGERNIRQGRIYAEEIKSVLLVQGIRNKDQRNSESMDYLFVLVNDEGNIINQTRIDFGYTRVLVGRQKLMDYTDSTEGEFKGFLFVFGEMPFQRRTRNPHRSLLDVVYIDKEGKLVFNKSFSFDDNPKTSANVKLSGAALIDNKVHLFGKAIIGRKGSYFYNVMDANTTGEALVIYSDMFLEAAYSEDEAHTTRGQRRAKGTLEEHGSLGFTMNNRFLLNGAINLHDDGLILYGQTFRERSTTSSSQQMQATNKPEPSPGYGDMVAFHFSKNGKFLNAWFGNIALESARKSSKSVIIPYVLPDKELIFISRKDVDEKIPNDISKFFKLEHYDPIKRTDDPSLPVIVHVDMKTNAVKNIEFTPEDFSSYPFNNYQHYDPNTNSLFIIGPKIQRTRNEVIPSLLIKEFKF